MWGEMYGNFIFCFKVKIVVWGCVCCLLLFFIVLGIFLGFRRVFGNRKVKVFLCNGVFSGGSGK